MHRIRYLFCFILPCALSCTNDRGDPSLYFNDPLLFSYGFYFTRPSAAVVHQEKYQAQNAVRDVLDLAVSRIEIWCYGFNEPSLIDALLLKKNKGVSIKITGSPDQDYSLLEEKGFSVMRRMKSGIQHAKIILVDRSILVGGTGNFTESGFFYNNNLFFILRIPEETGAKIAESLSREDIPSPRIRLSFGGEMMVSPERGRFIQSRILQAIANAGHRIQYMIFSHTDPVISDALFAASKRGVIVEGIYDSSGFTETLDANSEAFRLNQIAPVNFFIFLDGNRSRLEYAPGEFHGGHLHHKTLIIDNQTVLTGSYNWSMSARDSNLEAFFEFHDPFAATLFAEEFSRVKNEALYVHPSFPAGETLRSVTYDETLKNYCVSGPTSEESFTVFSGRGAYFRAEKYIPPYSGACTSQLERHHASSGPVSGSGYALTPDLSGNHVSNYVMHLNASHSKKRTSLPCENGHCSLLQKFRISLASGWIWLQGMENFQSIQIWDRNGMRAEESLTAVSPGFYTFSPASGDAVLFLKDPFNEIHMACVQNGATLDASLSYFVNAVSWFNDEAIQCTMDE